jgi:hypothetical protein
MKREDGRTGEADGRANVDRLAAIELAERGSHEGPMSDFSLKKLYQRYSYIEEAVDIPG